VLSILSIDLMLSMLLDLIISLLLIAWVQHQPGMPVLEIQLPPLQPLHLPA